MKNFKLTPIFILMLFFIACQDDDTDNSQTTVVGKVKYIKDDIEIPTIWYSDTIYVIDDHDFWVYNSLTIQAGTIIKFKYKYQMTIDKEGTLLANGTLQKPIIFTSFKDDAHGGDTNKDGNTSQPSPADWNKISISSNGNEMKYCIFMYGGSSAYLSTVEIYDGNASIQDCIFKYNKGGKFGDIYNGALDANYANDQTVIKNNIFYDNTIPLSISSVLDIDDSNVFHNPDSTIQINSMNGIFVYDQNEIIKLTQWGETEVPFVIHDVDLWIENPGKLKLADNVIVKFTPGSYLVLEDASLLQYNSTNTFTSFKDDNYGGDTNGDGNMTSPNRGDWGGIYNNKTGFYLHGINILYATY